MKTVLKSSCFLFLVTLFILSAGLTAHSKAGNCVAAFTFSVNPTNTNWISFIDQSTGDIANWKWDFSDGTFSTLPSPVHHYTGYNYSVDVTLYVWNADSSSFSSLTVAIFLPDTPGDCTAAFSYEQDSNNVIFFTDRSVGNVETWRWTFEQWQTSTLQNPQYAFPGPGTYSINLTIRNADSSCYASKNHYVDAMEDPYHCQADFVHHPEWNNLMEISFLNISLGKITQSYWDFGDSTHSHEVHPQHLYALPGTYQVTLTVKGPSSICNSTKTESVMVSDSDCFPDFNIWNNSQDPLTVTFNNQSLGNFDTTAWNFGDGATSTQLSPVHVYAALADYDVTLSLTGPDCQETLLKTISVIDSAHYYLHGKVFAGNQQATSGKVYAFEADTSSNYAPFIAETELDLFGNYLVDVPPGKYHLWAVPSIPGYLPTYFGDVLSWENDIITDPGHPGDPKDINLLACTEQVAGNGSIKGLISGGKTPDSYIGNIRIIIRNGSGAEIGFSTVGSDGVFSFSGLAFGTYFLVPELPGCEAEQVTVGITQASPDVEIKLSYSNGRIEGFDWPGIMAGPCVIFPNPAGEFVNISVFMRIALHALVIVTDLAGKTVSSYPIILEKGKNNVSFPLVNIEKGTYIITILYEKNTLLRNILIRL